MSNPLKPLKMVMHPTTRKILKYGVQIGGGATLGAYAAGFLASPPGERHVGAAQGAKVAGTLAAVTVGGLAGRRYIKRAAVNVANKIVFGKGAVAFRRYRGRIIPILAK